MSGNFDERTLTAQASSEVADLWLTRRHTCRSPCRTPAGAREARAERPSASLGARVLFS
jgi:hypothetical protein